MKKFLPFFLLQVYFVSTAQVGAYVYENITRQLKDSDLVFFDKGRAKFEQESYLEAIPLFEKIIRHNDQSPELFYLTGICYSYDANETGKAIQYIRRASSIAEKTDGYFFNLAYALEKNDSISQAIDLYKQALTVEEKKGMGKSTSLVREIKYRIERCNKINEYKNRQNIVTISNIGKPINSDASEYGPLITSNESVMIFTYRGPRSKGGKQAVIKGKKEDGSQELELYFEDVFMSKKINDTLWSDPQPIENLNTLLHDAAVCLSFDGSQLFIYRNNGEGKGDLFLSTLLNGVYQKPVYQQGLNSHEWEGSACFMPNPNMIIFASERKGGYGGKDLYTAEKIKPNVWGNVKNMGPTINTKYDEDAPFVTVDGKILFFSSNNHNSLGGYDVFRSDFKNGTWQTPFNLGPPINTKNDDKFFIVRADGKVGYYSTFKQGGKGEQDIYKIVPGIPGKPVELLEVNGFVTIDGKPTAASVEINSMANNIFDQKLKTNKTTGSFITNLPAGDKYEVTVKVDRFPYQVMELNTMGIDSFVVLNVYADFNSAEFDRKLEELNKENAAKEIVRGESFDKELFASRFGNTRKDELYYTVQIGAYKFFENFNYNNILGFPKIVRQTGSDYITRFIMGNYPTYNDALELLTRIKKTDALKDAFIVAFYKDQRKYLQELITEKILE